MLKLPLISVEAFLSSCPFTLIVAPINGCPFSSFTVPETTIVESEPLSFDAGSVAWGNEWKQPHADKIIVKTALLID